LFYAGAADVPTDKKSGELDGAALPLMAMTIDWTANGWGAGPLAGSRPAAGAWAADFVVLATQPKSSKGQDARG